MKSLNLALAVLIIVGVASATIVPFTLEGYPNCKCFCSKLPPLRDLLCEKLFGPLSLGNMLKSAVPAIRPCPYCPQPACSVCPICPVAPAPCPCAQPTCSACSNYSPCGCCHKSTISSLAPLPPFRPPFTAPAVQWWQ